MRSCSCPLPVALSILKIKVDRSGIYLQIVVHTYILGIYLPTLV